MEYIRKYRQEIKRGAFWVVVGTLLFIAYQVVVNGPFVLSTIGNILGHFLDVVSPIIWAFALAYLLYYPVRGIQKLLIKGYQRLAKKEIGVKGFGITRVISIILVFIILIYLIRLMILFIFPPLIENIQNLIAGLPAFGERVDGWMSEVTNFVGTFEVDWNLVWHQAIEMMKSTLLTAVQLLISSLSIAIGSISSFVVDFVVTIILTFYFLKDKEKIFAALNKFFSIIMKERTLKMVKGFLKDLDDVVGKFLVGTIFASTVVGIISSVLMMLIKHPFAVLVGVVAGVTNVIPYVGPLIGALLALVLGIFKSVEVGVLGFLLLILYQQVDGNIIQPKIVGESVGVAPVWILMAVLIGGSYFGGIGMIISVPIAALASVYIERIYQKKIKN